MKKLKYKGDLCLIQSPSNLFYFSSYENADAVLIFAEGKRYYFTDSRYFEEFRSLKGNFIVKDIAELCDFLSGGNFVSASIESNLPMEFYLFLQRHSINDLNFIDNEISALRAIKSSRELSLIKKAQLITDTTFEKILSCIEEGMTERELASKLEATLFLCGADKLAFDSIVAFGTNTARPHAHRGETRLKKGMPITLDFGAKYGGYCSDMTRTVFFGDPGQEMRRIYESVLCAQEYAINNIKSGMMGRECDELARSVFREKNLEAYFIHSLGHGIGIDCHEKPNFSPKCQEIIGQGMVMSVEPGLYFEGKYGIRIEDLIYFDESGIINLTKSPKNMIIL